MNKLKYLGYSIVFQEVPNEVTLAINISGCPHRCEGCHSEYLWRYEGDYISDDLETIIQKYKDLITCVCFMGGDRSPKRINHLLQFVKEEYDLKTAWYSGADKLNRYVSFANLNYFKLGPFRKDLGGLDKYPLTNQRMYQIDPAPVDNPFGAVFIQTDITKKFVHNNEDISKDTKF